MIGRKKLNKPVGRAKGRPIAWVSELGVGWFCNSCRCCVEPNNVAVEFVVKAKDKSDTTPFKKVFLCGACTKKVCEELTELIDTISAAGIKTYKTMEDI